MITLTITSDSAKDLIDQVRDLQAELIGQVVNHSGLPSKESLKNINETLKATATVTPEVVADAPKKKAAAKKEVVAPVETPVATATVTAAGGLTKEDIAEATQRVSAAKNLEVARAIMAQFKKEDGSACARISDVQTKDYENYIATCDATIEG